MSNVLVAQPGRIESEALKEAAIVRRLASSPHRLGAKAAQLHRPARLLIECGTTEERCPFGVDRAELVLGSAQTVDELLKRTRREAHAEDERGGKTQLGKCCFKHTTLFFSQRDNKTSKKPPGAEVKTFPAP